MTNDKELLKPTKAMEYSYSIGNQNELRCPIDVIVEENVGHDDDDNNEGEKENEIEKKKQRPIGIIDDIDVEDGSDSCASMETLSDNVSIWIDGEKHWISGIDENTTCAQLICALLNYQQDELKQEQQGLDMAMEHSMESKNPTKSHQHRQQKQNQEQQQQQQQQRSIKADNKAINQSTTNTKADFKGGTKPNTLYIPSSPILNDYVIVKQLRHCEEYLDGSTKVFDVLPARDTFARKECELLLRHLPAPDPKKAFDATKVSSFFSTDKDSGMGSPVGSSRSARLRRRKHKSTFGFRGGLHSNTLHPKISGSSSVAPTSANERLMKIILAQDETIHRQLSMLREKEHQILKIEEEKHRVRERELGKNYLLDTYLNALDEAEPTHALSHDDINALGVHPIEFDDTMGMSTLDLENGVEIFIDEPYQRNQNEIYQKHQQIPVTLQSSGIYAAGNDIIGTGNLMNSNTDGIHYDGCNDTAIDLQLYWLEKVYSVNKKLQREEELLLKLTAKIRKHQVKRAYQTKNEVLQQIDKLDDDLAVQIADIHGVERKLLMANEQLKAKLVVLECLSEEFEEKHVPRNPLVKGFDTKVDDQTVSIVQRSIELPISKTTLPATVTYTQLKGANDVLMLQKLIEKPIVTAQSRLVAFPEQEQIIIEKNTQWSDTKCLEKQMFAWHKTDAHVPTVQQSYTPTQQHDWQSVATQSRNLQTKANALQTTQSDITNLGTLV